VEFANKLEVRFVNSLITGAIVLALLLGSALIAMSVRKLLPEHHLDAESKDVTRLSITLIASMTALVLSLLIASARSGYDARRTQVVQLSANVVLLDGALSLYGPETRDIRLLLRESIAATVERYWPAAGAQPKAIALPDAPVETLYQRIAALSPRTDQQTALRNQMLTLALDTGRSLSLLFGNLGTAIPEPFLVVLVFWLCLIFASYGLFARRNTTVVVVLSLCALSAASAIFLILELDRPVGSLLQVPSDSLRAALAQLAR
jgi:hypothetical protein